MMMMMMMLINTDHQIEKILLKYRLTMILLFGIRARAIITKLKKVMMMMMMMMMTKRMMAFLICC